MNILLTGDATHLEIMKNPSISQSQSPAKATSEDNKCSIDVSVMNLTNELNFEANKDLK